MGAGFIGCDRDQVFLMRPSLRDWVPKGHLVWTVLDAVGELDLSALYADYRDDGRGRPAYEPSMMVALLLYAYARGNRSSRGIERACVEDIAYRVVAGNLAADHSTIAEFRCRHEQPLAEVFSGVLGLCARAGLVSVGMVAIDGTKIAANASSDANRNMLLESEGLQDKPGTTAAQTIADVMTKALGLRSSRVTYSSITVDDHTTDTTSERLHTAYAMRFGDEEGGDRASGDEPARAAQLRDAFNSPYWPFILVSTAVGQECLDFPP